MPRLALHDSGDPDSRAGRAKSRRMIVSSPECSLRWSQRFQPVRRRPVRCPTVSETRTRGGEASPAALPCPARCSACCWTPAFQQQCAVLPKPMARSTCPGNKGSSLRPCLYKYASVARLLVTVHCPVSARRAARRLAASRYRAVLMGTPTCSPIMAPGCSRPVPAVRLAGRGLSVQPLQRA